jgi:hypothetical protein
VDNVAHTQSPAGFAPADGWKPTGPEMHRSVDRWVACNLTKMDPDTLVQIGKTLQFPEGEGLRVRFVLKDIEDEELGVPLVPALRTLLGDHCPAFLHAELMQGPEEGVFLASDNRLPALICQQWLPDTAAIQGQKWLDQLPKDQPLHVNVLFHGEGSSYSGAAGQLEPLLHWLEKRKSPVHQISMAFSNLHPSGYSIGIESRLNEHGSLGGNPAVD